MTAHPYRISRSAGPVAVVMLMLLLAAGLLYSAASAHHHPHSTAIGMTVADQHSQAHHHDAHEHRHGNEWAPHLGQRLRPLAAVNLIGLAGHQLLVPAPGPAVAGRRLSEPPPPADLSQLSVLRV